MQHLLNFYSHGKPVLVLREHGEVRELEMRGRVALELSSEKRCIGYRTPEGFEECASNSGENVKQCGLCSWKDIARVYTVGDFSVHPEMRGKCESEEYVIYLAGFAEHIIKVGLTRRERLLERWLEQGADFGAELASVQGPYEAYPLEAKLQEKFGFVNAVRASTKIAYLEFDREHARKNFKAALEKVRASDLVPETGKAIDLSSHYPKADGAQETKEISGKVIGAKGSLLFMENENRIVFTNMKKSLGKFALD